MKVGREQIAGLLTAIREFVAAPDAWRAHYTAELAACAAELRVCPALALTENYNHHLDVPVLSVNFGATVLSANEVVRRLDTGDPRIHIGEEDAWRNVLTVNPMGLGTGDGARVGQRVVKILAAAGEAR
jgi:hypothetical protein